MGHSLISFPENQGKNVAADSNQLSLLIVPNSHWYDYRIAIGVEPIYTERSLSSTMHHRNIFYLMYEVPGLESNQRSVK